MKNKQAFTLIELLVVILIIGILTAVAVPQYQKAVEKSKAAQALTLLKTLTQSYQSYYLANGEWATSFSQLDVQIPWSGTSRWWDVIEQTRSSKDWSAQLILMSQNKIPVIFIGRLSGPYAGGGFAYFFQEWGDSNSPMYVAADTLTCVEFTGNPGVKFSKKPGDFCQKVMKSTRRLQAGSDISYYNMP